MNQFTIPQLVLIMKTFYQNRESYAVTVRRLRAILGRNKAQYESIVRRLMRKFNETGSTVNIISPGCHLSGRYEPNIVVVRDSVAVRPMKPVASSPFPRTGHRMFFSMENSPV